MTIKAALKKILRQFGIYNSFRYSTLYYWLLKYKDPSYNKALNDDLAFYRDTFNTTLDTVFDIGANHGDKTWVFKQLANRVVCVEPDSNCFVVLRTRYSRDSSVSLENIALGEQVGQATFYVEAEGSFYNTLSEKQKNWLLSNRKPNDLKERIVSVSTLDNLIAKYGTPDYVKIDVEGYELPVLNGLSYMLPVISFEANLPHFRQETLCIIEHFTHKGPVQFNLRLGNDFVFSSPRHCEDIKEALNSDQQITYEVFVYNRAE